MWQERGLRWGHQEDPHDQAPWVDRRAVVRICLRVGPDPCRSAVWSRTSGARSRRSREKMGGPVQWLPQAGPTDLPELRRAAIRLQPQRRPCRARSGWKHRSYISMRRATMTVDVERAISGRASSRNGSHGPPASSNDVINNAFNGEHRLEGRESAAWRARQQFPVERETESLLRRSRDRCGAVAGRRRTTSGFCSIAASAGFRRRSRRQ